MSNINIKPIGEYILVEPLEQEEKTASGLLVQTTQKGERPQRGKVAALGTGKRDESGNAIAFNVEVGNEVLFKKYAPEDIEMDGKTYLLMKEADILAVLVN
jgi:chaperonin GroES